MKPGCESTAIKPKRSIELPVIANNSDTAGGIRHSKASWWRAFALIALNLLMIAHFIQWQITGSTVSPIEPSESMYTLRNGAINAGFIFFTLAILATLIFGRFVCGWGCHILALQDLCAWMLKKAGLKPRAFRSRLLVFVPLVAALYMFVWPTVQWALTKPKDAPLIPGFTNHLVTTEFWATFPTFWVAVPFLFICGFATVYFLGSKGFCTYACPYGGFFSIADKLAPGKIRVTDACNQCGHCTATCTSNVIVHAEVKEFGMVVDPGCMKCMDCISVCPNDALYFGFGKPSITLGTKSIEKNYSVSWPEEIFAAAVFFFSLLAVWDVYQLVPMLMALGIAAVSTFVAVRTLKLVRSSDLSFYKYNLRSKGKIKTAGWTFLVFAVFWLGLVAQSGFVRYNERAGAVAFENLAIPDELALARPNPERWLSPSDKTSIASGKAAFLAAQKVGFFTNVESLPKLAWFEYLSGNNERAVDLLGTAANRQQGQAMALSLYYRGAILNRIGHPDRAIADLTKAVDARPDLITAREEIGESLWAMNRRDEAMAAWTAVLKENPNMPVAASMLAGGAAAQGNPESAAAYQQQADRTTPNDPLFYWMLGLRLQNMKMDDLAEQHFQRAIQLNPQFRRAGTTRQ